MIISLAASLRSWRGMFRPAPWLALQRAGRRTVESQPDLWPHEVSSVRLAEPSWLAGAEKPCVDEAPTDEWMYKSTCAVAPSKTHTHTHRHRHRHTHTHSLISGWVSHRQSPGPWVTLRPPCFSRRSTTRDRERMGSFVSTYLLHGTPGWEQREEQQVRPYVLGQRWDETTLCRFICQVGPELLWLQQVSSDQSSP